ncbi:uncharacterized protein ASPGLDRAFT_35150 [Aspergillus glaucus CBS 516.65]|uniref:Uncharacterized protein n=1 Tax=Aspergillus glaucus CBS 516.65 TaxID=1160497 RepID=A0A1L9VL61_ASPGL|nr:hypothetical protein ASPGLDRAFT_35150 [Aspergillus glaucus CBS 516.65]OJJ84667.1 hypothetical protein ASPGLDRAFT_35150 [Aspergillus glaucus CBS 516.65]
MSDNQPPQPPPPSSKTTSSNKPPTTTSSSNANQNTTNTQNANTNQSLPSRLQSSATTLAQNLFTPSPADIARNLQPGGGSSTKAAPPSATSAASAAQTFHEETATPGGSSAGRGISRHGDVGDSFRNATENATGQDGLMEEAYQFQNDHAYKDGGLESGVPFYEQDTDIKRKGKGKAPDQDHQQDHDHQSFDNTWNSITTTKTTQIPPQSAHAHAHANPQDGSELLTLLTSPSFNPDFPEPPTTNPDSTLIPNDLSDPTPFPLSQSEIQILESFRRNLSPHHTPHHQQRNLNAASLIPDIDNFLSTVPAQTQNDATALRDAVLTGLPGAEEWVVAEERYQDEVWGFLKPVLEEARREIEERGEEQGQEGEGEDGPAVARLKMILRHMGA